MWVLGSHCRQSASCTSSCCPQRTHVALIAALLCPAGELNFVVIGVVLQMCSICTESTRLVLVQILLQRRGLKLNPITTL